MQQFNKIRHYMIVRNKVFIGVFFLIVLPFIVKAQNNSSPYSIIGIGNIENSDFDRYTGMANAGLALSDIRYINSSNAASLPKLGNHVFSFEMALRSSIDDYSGGGLSTINPNNPAPSPTFDVAFRKLAVATKITSKWGSTIGLQPYSTANYDYTASKLIEGSNSDELSAEYHGSGGVNQFYWGNGYQITKNTSVGVNSSILFGSLKQSETLLSSDVLSGLVTTDNIYLTGAYFNFSLQTKKRLSSSWMSTYGITYSPQTTLHAAYDVTVTDNTLLDTLKNDPTINDRFTIPALFSAGIAFIKNDKYTFTVNAQQQNWSDIRGNAFQPVGGANYTLSNSNKLSFGYQKENKVKNFYGVEYEKSFFQLGAYAGNTYLQVSGQQLTDFGVTLGYGRNAKRSPLGYYIALEAGRRGSENTTVLSENYLNINLVFSYIDRWYKGKKYY
jgi:hypothetical protein